MQREQIEQKKLAAWLDANHFWWLHVPNERRANVQHYANMKKLGVKKGVPDNLIVGLPKGAEWRESWHPGIAIELKAASGRAGAEQLAWIEVFRRIGWVAAVCHGADGAIEFVLRYVVLE